MTKQQTHVHLSLAPMIQRAWRGRRDKKKIFVSVNEESEILICDVLRSVYISSKTGSGGDFLT